MLNYQMHPSIQQSIIQQFRNYEIIKSGSFTLKSGVHSDTYCDMRLIMGYPELLKQVSYYLGKMINHDHDEIVIVGVPLGALPFATMVAVQFGLPCIMLRDKPKSYGLQNIIEGRHFNKRCGGHRRCDH